MQATPKVNSKFRILRIFVFAIVLIAVSLAVIMGARCFLKFWAPNYQGLSVPDQQADLYPDPVSLKTTSSKVLDPGGFLDGDFTIVTRMAEVAQGCRDIFESSFVNVSGQAVSSGQVPFADPGQDFEAIDAIRGGLPFRRLLLAGLGSRTCFIYYERGGTMFPSSCLAIIDYEQKKAVWVGKSNKKVRSFRALRSLLSRGNFGVREGPVC